MKEEKDKCPICNGRGEILYPPYPYKSWEEVKKVQNSRPGGVAVIGGFLGPCECQKECKVEEDVIDADVSLYELKDSPLIRAILDEIDEAWVGVDEERAIHPRCGTIYVSNKEGLGEVRLALRFPLDLDTIRVCAGITDDECDTVQLLPKKELKKKKVNPEIYNAEITR